MSELNINIPKRKLDIPKKDFLAYALYLDDRRNYEATWKWVIFKVNYGEWVNKSVRFTDGVEVQPKKPTKEFLQWLDEYQNRV